MTGVGDGKTPLRFLYLHPLALPGVEANLVQTTETCRALAERGHEVFLIVTRLKEATAGANLAPFDVRPHENLHLVAEPAIRLKNASGSRSWFVRAALLWYLRGLVRRGRTVLYFRTLKDSRLARFLLTAGRLLRVPVVFEAHKVVQEKREDQGFHAGTLRRIRRLEGRVLARADGVVASHPLLEARLRDGLRPLGPLVVAPNGVRAADAAGAEREFDAVYAGSLFEWKGVDVCLEAVARQDGVRLAVVGGNPPERLEALKEKARALGLGDRVTWFGQRPRAEALEIVGRSRCALVPLDPEFEEGERYTCPLKMLEAMVRGVVVVAADTPAIRAFVTPDVSALLYPKGDAAAMAARIEEALADPARAAALAAAGRALALEASFGARARTLETFVRGLL
ncbi:MAG: glycosyltransferase [Planctomycetota bacterium JB042]